MSDRDEVIPIPEPRRQQEPDNSVRELGKTENGLRKLEQQERMYETMRRRTGRR